MLPVVLSPPLSPPETFSFEMVLKPSALVATKCDVKPEETLPKVDASLNGNHWDHWGMLHWITGITGG